MTQVNSTGGSFTSPKKLLNELEVSEILNVSVRQVANLRERRLISYIKLGRAVRFDPDLLRIEIGRLSIQCAAE
ncbi:MAG: helix-turn-helix domain-containing protein [Candidatus Didemnitutus sp.]|nr:helix-turn-helix domain-containing protein [Candidatus Didemnitutus sp.]